MDEKITVDICSPPDREKLVASIMIGNEQLAELNQEGDSLVLEIYPRRTKQYWQINFAALMEALAEAGKRLTGA